MVKDHDNETQGACLFDIGIAVEMQLWRSAHGGQDELK